MATGEHSMTFHLIVSREITNLLLLNINLNKLDIGELALKLGKVGRDHLARTAPSRPVVDDDDIGARNLREQGQRITIIIMQDGAYESLPLVVRFNSLDHFDVLCDMGR